MVGRDRVDPRRPVLRAATACPRGRPARAGGHRWPRRLRRPGRRAGRGDHDAPAGRGHGPRVEGAGHRSRAGAARAGAGHVRRRGDLGRLDAGQDPHVAGRGAANGGRRVRPGGPRRLCVRVAAPAAHGRGGHARRHRCRRAASRRGGQRWHDQPRRPADSRSRCGAPTSTRSPLVSPRACRPTARTRACPANGPAWASRSTWCARRKACARSRSTSAGRRPRRVGPAGVDALRAAGGVARSGAPSTAPAVERATLAHRRRGLRSPRSRRRRGRP